MSTYVTNLEFENAWERISNKLSLIEFDSARAANSFQNPIFEEAIEATPLRYKMEYEKLVSILYGQNGSGKTTSMRMLSGLTELVRGLLKQYNNHDNYSNMYKLYEDLIKHGTFPENLVSSEEPNFLEGLDMSNNEIISNIKTRERESKAEFNLELCGFHHSHQDYDSFDYKFKIKLQRTETLAENYLHPALQGQYSNFNGDYIYFFHLELEKLNDKLVVVDEGEIMQPTLKPLTESELAWDDYFSDKNILPFLITDDLKVISLPPYYCNWFYYEEKWEDEGVDWERLSKKEEFLETIEYNKVTLDVNREILSNEMLFQEFFTNMFPLVPNEKFHTDLLDEYDFWHLGADTDLGDLLKMSEYFKPFNEIIEGISSDITNISDLEIRIEPINDIGKSTSRIDLIDIVKELKGPIRILLKNEKGNIFDYDMFKHEEKWEEYNDEDKKRFHLGMMFSAFANLANTKESFERHDDPVWIKENSEDLCKIFLHLTDFFLLRIYEKGTHRIKARRSIRREFGVYSESFNKELMEYSFEDMNYFEILDLCRSRIELIKSYLIPNYFIHIKNEFTRKIVKRFTGINIESIHLKMGRPKLSIDGLSVKFEDLSSGQKRIIQLITALLSNDVNGPIMIDEPEISLHPIWLTELKEIITNCMEYSKRQVIICTHSPELVYLFEDAIPVENFSKVEE